MNKEVRTEKNRRPCTVLIEEGSKKGENPKGPVL